MKQKFYSLILMCAVLLSPMSLSALTLADIELLISLGILNSEQAELARGAIGQSNATAPGTAGSTIQNGVNQNIKCLTLSEDVVLGDSGSVVSALQQFLQNEGHYSYPKITEYFGAVTQTAVADFQLAEGLITSRAQAGAGGVGPLTRERIQQVSCNRANSLVTRTPAENTIGSEPGLTDQAIGQDDGTFVRSGSELRFARRQSGGAAGVADSLETNEVTLDSVQTAQYLDEGITVYRYEVEFEPDEDEVEYFVFTLVCDRNNVEFKREEFNDTCGESAIIDSNSAGKASFKISFENVGGLNQTVGMGVEAYNDMGQLLGLDEIIDELPEADGSRRTSQEDEFKGYVGIEDGGSFGFSGASSVSVTDRGCSRREQLDYIRFVMTATVPEGENPPLPPGCSPGNLQCSFQSPPTYCEFVDGPNSGDLCSGSNHYFYDGKCMKESEILKFV